MFKAVADMQRVEKKCRLLLLLAVFTCPAVAAELSNPDIETVSTPNSGNKRHGN